MFRCLQEEGAPVGCQEGFGPLVFPTHPCLPFGGKECNPLRSLVKSKELFCYSWQHVPHRNPMNQIFHSRDEAAGSQESEIPVLWQQAASSP